MPTDHVTRIRDPTTPGPAHTAELCGANPFDYLVVLQRYAAAVAPARWMPWNYPEALVKITAPASPTGPAP